MTQQAWEQGGEPPQPIAAGPAPSRPGGAYTAVGGEQAGTTAVPPRKGTSTSRLTGRGGVLLMAGVFIVGMLASTVFGWTVLVGVGFLAGSAAAARYTKPAHLLTVSVTPPLVFFCLLVCAKAIPASGNVLVSVAGGSALELARVAPWLFVGTAASLVIAWRRGLPQCVRDLRRELSFQSVKSPRPAASARAWPPRKS